MLNKNEIEGFDLSSFSMALKQRDEDTAFVLLSDEQWEYTFIFPKEHIQQMRNSLTELLSHWKD